MEYTNIDASFNGLICKKVDVIDPENDNIIEMQKITKKKSKINSFILSLTIIFFLFIYFVLNMFYHIYKVDLKSLRENIINKNLSRMVRGFSAGVVFAVCSMASLLVGAFICIILALIGVFNS